MRGPDRLECGVTYVSLYSRLYRNRFLESHNLRRTPLPGVPGRGELRLLGRGFVISTKRLHGLHIRERRAEATGGRKNPFEKKKGDTPAVAAIYAVTHNLIQGAKLRAEAAMH